jgi:hypothetical protein
MRSETVSRIGGRLNSMAKPFFLLRSFIVSPLLLYNTKLLRALLAEKIGIEEAGEKYAKRGQVVYGYANGQSKPIRLHWGV